MTNTLKQGDLIKRRSYNTELSSKDHLPDTFLVLAEDILLVVDVPPSFTDAIGYVEGAGYGHYEAITLYHAEFGMLVWVGSETDFWKRWKKIDELDWMYE